MGEAVRSQGNETLIEFFYKYVANAEQERACAQQQQQQRQQQSARAHGKSAVASRTFCFPQGARFAVARDVIRRRPRALYARLLERLSMYAQPYAAYYMEAMWPYLLLGPDGSEECVHPTGHDPHNN